MTAPPLEGVVSFAYDKWRKIQACTQFQGEGSSHQLTCILLTETIQYSLFHVHQPIFIIFLDVSDVLVRQNALIQAYKAETTEQSSIFLDNRLKGRQTFVEWEKTLMGPIIDKCRLEQGAMNSNML